MISQGSSVPSMVFLDSAVGTSGTGVASGLRIIKATLAKIIGVSVAHNGSANNGCLTRKLKESIIVFVSGDTVLSCGNVSHVSDVAFLVSGATVGLLEGVVVGTGGLAPFGEVAEFVDVEAMDSGGESLDLGLNVGRAIALLGEPNKASHTGVV